MERTQVEVLKQLRIRMVEQRRALAGRDADLGYSDTRTQKLVALQIAIEAVDRAIADEVELAHSNPVTAETVGQHDSSRKTD